MQRKHITKRSSRTIRKDDKPSFASVRRQQQFCSLRLCLKSEYCGVYEINIFSTCNSKAVHYLV
ncbi:hypothetical protein BDA96_09G014700 [Sorghum bicolor]|uniref:Uncharacterized protein n=2 Tax=Sorghum bicolor TaxID=4558 RepID=A0A921Q7R1_SORBI|nr:hypothetical protein BDA96_09G014700 [Sorghum bicolor]OQU77240.1 hypothetical protein SORBI_3009G014332 [Sorghum bicolor]